MNSQDGFPVNHKQIEQLTVLGTRLRELRQSQQLSIEQIASKTHIQPRLLRAIEQGRLSELPEPIYIQSFLRQYAEALGLDGGEFAQEFPATTRLGSLSRPRLPWWQMMTIGQLRPMHLYVIYVLLMVAAVNSLSGFLGQSQSPLATTEKLPPTQISDPIAPVKLSKPRKQSTTAQAEHQPSIASNVAPKVVRADMRLTAQSWVRILADNRVEFEGLLPEGEQRTWTANQRLVIRAGNAGGVKVALNSGQAKLLGQLGQVGELTWPPEAQLANLPEANSLLFPLP